MSVSAEIINNLTGAKILALGDVMLDIFIYGTASRISPEAPVPVLLEEYRHKMAGGAGNVASNLCKMQSDICFISICGDDEEGAELHGIMQKQGGKILLEREKGRITTTKRRMVSGSQQLLRLDREEIKPLSDEVQEKILKSYMNNIANYDIILLSDYGKGFFAGNFCQKLIKIANNHDKKVIIDPKSRDFSIYSGAYMLSPNLGELENACGKKLMSEEEITITSRELLQKFAIQNMMVTRGKNGISLINQDIAVHYPALAREVYDVSGAGDSVIATAAICLSKGVDLSQMAYLANVAGAAAVSKLGTAAISLQDLQQILQIGGNNKVYTADNLQDLIAHKRQQGKKIGFTNGCFDLLHIGHISLLEQARNRCDFLIVAINSDDSVRRLKGDSRPIQNEISRSNIIAALQDVDAVVIFGEDTPQKLIEMIRPDLLVKGADYSEDQVVGGDFVKSYGGKIYLAEISIGHSTTNLLKKSLI